MPAREVFFNVPFGWLVYPLVVFVAIAIAFPLYRRFRAWRRNAPPSTPGRIRDAARFFIATTLREAFWHRRLLQQLYSGIMHALIFGGAIVLLVLGAFADFVSHYIYDFLHGPAYLWNSLILDLAGLAILMGILMAAIRRYIMRPARLSNLTDNAVILLLIALIVLSGFFVEGLRIAATELKTQPDWAVWSPAGYVIARAVAGVGDGTLLFWHRAVWWIHLVIVLGGVVYLFFAFSSLTHMFMAPVNIFLRGLRPRGVLSAIDLENIESFGVQRIQDLPWKQRFDLDACVRCGRCQENCPAFLTGKPLSPKKLILALRGYLVSEGALSPVQSPSGQAEGDGHRAGQPILGEAVSEEEVWACTTCGACEEVCPIFVEHIEKIVGMRRYLVMELGQVPGLVRTGLECLRKKEEPWQGPSFPRTDWAASLGLKTLAEDPEAKVIFWPGCSQARQERNLKAMEAFARLMKAAGVKLGVLGQEQSCCGHFARRIGDEYLFQLHARQNVEALKKYNVKTIVTMCPHCLHTLKNEYRQFGGNFEVLHYSEILLRLVKKGKLKPKKGLEGILTFQDPCYLGRYCNIYSQPRKLLATIPGARTVEMAHHHKRSLCCGAGGGRMWMEEPPQQRVSLLRTREAIGCGADIIVTACPFCLLMLEDSTRTLEEEKPMRAMDLAEVLLSSLALPADSEAPASKEPVATGGEDS
jgi:Fe-S oxidoreductase/nitrate reductase gamma subunit